MSQLLHIVNYLDNVTNYFSQFVAVFCGEKKVPQKTATDFSGQVEHTPETCSAKSFTVMLLIPVISSSFFLNSFPS